MTNIQAMASVTVEIFGRTYQIRAKDDPQYVQNLAKMINDRMVEVEKSTKTVDSVRVAVLTTLNMMDEFLKAQTRYEERIKDLEQEQQRLLEVVERTLKESPITPA